MLNNGICAICKTNKWTILCPECSRPLCSDCMKDLDGYHRCERCLNKDLKRGEQYSHAVYTVLKDERTKEQFGNLFWDMVETMFESLSFDTDGMLHYKDGQVFYLTKHDIEELGTDILIPELNELLVRIGEEPLTFR